MMDLVTGNGKTRFLREKYPLGTFIDTENCQVFPDNLTEHQCFLVTDWYVHVTGVPNRRFTSVTGVLHVENGDDETLYPVTNMSRKERVLVSVLCQLVLSLEKDVTVYVVDDLDLIVGDNVKPFRRLMECFSRFGEKREVPIVGSVSTFDVIPLDLSDQFTYRYV